MNEKDLLCKLNHNYLVNLIYAFQDRDNLYFVMDLLKGGDLRFHMAVSKRFTEVQSKFFVACIVQCLEYLHNNKIIHGNIKPESLLMDEFGYIKVTNLGYARFLKQENFFETDGTPGYMAPEILCKQNHGLESDFYSLGVVVYELMLGRIPEFTQGSMEDLKKLNQPSVKNFEIPKNWSIQSQDFINQLLQKDNQKRLGFNGIDEIKNHPWLINFPWSKLPNREIIAPLINSSPDEYFEYIQRMKLLDQSLIPPTEQQYKKILKNNSVQSKLYILNYLDLFTSFFYDGSKNLQNMVEQYTGGHPMVNQFNIIQKYDQLKMAKNQTNDDIKIIN